MKSPYYYLCGAKQFCKCTQPVTLDEYEQRKEMVRLESIERQRITGTPSAHIREMRIIRRFRMISKHW